MGKLTKAKVKSKKALTRRLVIPADDADAKALERAQQREQRARLLGDSKESSEAAETLKRTTDEVSDRGLVFVFRGIGRKPYEQLLRDHPPTDEQKAAAGADRVPQWNVDTFPAALCFASITDSDLSEQDWIDDVFNSADWGPGELSALFNAALDANSDRRVADLGN